MVSPHIFLKLFAKHLNFETTIFYNSIRMRGRER